MLRKAFGALPSRLQRPVRRAVQRTRGTTRHRGTAVLCPCCGATFRDFGPLNETNRRCWKCDSLERQRLLWLYLDRHPELLGSSPRVLHVAPEPSLRPRLQAASSTYTSGDLKADFGPRRIDVTALQFHDDSFDIVVCNHVLEHVPDDSRAMAELYRVLAPGGWALLLVPDVEAATTEEDPTAADPAERLRRFGQHDHVRRYGWDYVDRLEAAGFDVEVVKLEDSLTPTDIERMQLAKSGRIEPIFIARKTGQLSHRPPIGH